MQHAKKMFLVDQRTMDKLRADNWQKPIEHMLDKLKRKEVNSWQRPVEKRSKTNLSLEMKNILRDEDLTDDLKAKEYQQVLARFLNTKTKTKDAPIDKVEPQPEAATKSIKRHRTPKKTKQVSTPRQASSTKKIKRVGVPLYPLRKSARAKKQATNWMFY
jgi:hypothetical protein